MPNDEDDTGSPSSSLESSTIDSFPPLRASAAVGAGGGGAPATLDYSSLLPSGPKSLSGISLRAFLLGNLLALSLALSLHLALRPHRLWRAPFFLALLALFHFLEYYVTAARNTRRADVDAFLLTTNGAAYNVAHASALAECVLTSCLFPRWQAALSNAWTLPLALALVAAGQAARSAAMATAGANFNHTVQTRRAAGHELVTAGIYGRLRHPSYFGFFWWALGTQVLCGNVVCAAGYAVVLGRFFSRRIKAEERFLVEFFGDEYVRYRERTHVGIPFI